MRGRLKTISKDMFSGKTLITFEVDSLEMETSTEIEFDIEVKRWSKKRSLDANAYFHSLVGKIADMQNASKPYIKNLLLGRYGQREVDENGNAVKISVFSDIPILEREDIHCIPIGYTTLQGKEFTHYAVLRPSHTLNQSEFSKLIEGTVSEAKDLGIETLPPDEIARMEALWKEKKL